jgi:hypothetical protein
MNGALNLAVFVRCLRIDSKVPGFSLTVIGHSYGSTVVGLAAAKTGALDGDNVVFVGSPGVDAHSVRELGQPKAVYAGENPNDFIQLFTDPAVQYLNNSLVSHQLVCHALLQVLSKFVGPWDVCGMLQQMAHGPNPTGLVDARHHFSTEGECGHGYFDDPTGHGTEGLQNLARITMGDGAQVTQERRAPIAPFTVHVNGTIKVQAGPFTIVQLPNITGITVNWTVSCKNPAQADSGARLIDVANYDATSDVLSTTTAGLNIVVPKGSAQKMASVSVHVQARTSEQLNMTLVAPGGKKAGAASATSHRPITIIATGEQTAAHAGHVTVRMRITSKGLRYLQAAAAHGITTLTPILAVQIRVRGRLGYFAGPVPVRVHV